MSHLDAIDFLCMSVLLTAWTKLNYENCIYVTGMQEYIRTHKEPSSINISKSYGSV